MRPQYFGNIRVDRVVEIDRLGLDAKWLFPAIDTELLSRARAEYGAEFVGEDQTLALSFHGYLVRTPELTILVDTCIGQHKTRPTMPWQHQLASTRYLDTLAGLGVRPEDVDIVLCTHLHADHVGWNTVLRDGRWVPTFPRARYLISRLDFEHLDGLRKADPGRLITHGSFEDSVLPIIGAGQAELVETDHAVCRHLDDAVRIQPSPGHTPGHYTVHIRSPAREGLICGDVLHHPVQLYDPLLAGSADIDAAAAGRSRQELLAYCADRDRLLLTIHFLAPTAGRVVPSGGAFRFEFIDI